jgi:hypothetical protein
MMLHGASAVQQSQYYKALLLYVQIGMNRCASGMVLGMYQQRSRHIAWALHCARPDR